MGAIESAVAIATKSRAVPLSEQEIVDCSYFYGNLGCNGGMEEFVYKYAIDEGVSKKKDYKYTGKVLIFII